MDKKENLSRNSGNEKRSKRHEKARYATLFMSVFAISACTAYWLTPGKTATLGQDEEASSSGESIIDAGDTMTPTEHLMSALSNVKGVQATIDSFACSIKNSKNDAYPQAVSLDQGAVLNLYMNGYPDYNLSFNGTVKYNGLSVDLGLAYADANVYLKAVYAPSAGKGFDLRYRTKADTKNDILSYIYDLFGEEGIPTPDLSGLSTSQMSSKMGGMSSEKTNEGYTYTIALDAEKTNNIYLYSDASYNLKSVKADNVSIGNATMSFLVNLNVNATFVSESAFIPADKASYLDAASSLGLVKKVVSLVQKKQFGLNLNLTMDHTVTEEGSEKTYRVGAIDGNANLDADKVNFAASLAVSAPNEKTLLANEAGAEKTVQNLSANYVQSGSGETKDAVVYASYNDALKVKATQSVFENLIKKVKADFPAKDSANASTTFNFITSSTVMTAIANGQYEKVAGLLDKITFTDNKVLLSVNLKDLGLGEASNVTVTLDGTDSSASLASIQLSGIVMSDYVMNGTIALADYVTPSLVEADYQTLDRLPNIYDQFYDLSQNTQASAEISGSVVDYDSTTEKGKAKTGFTFTGNTTFDANQDTSKDASAKSGTGNIAIVDYAKTPDDPQTHKVGIDVRGTDKMLFRYTTSATAYKDYLNGKFTIDTLNDIIDLVKRLTQTNDRRYTKFLDSFKETSATTVVGQLANKDFEALLRKKVLTKLNVEDGEIRAVLAKSLLGSTSDLDITLGLDAAGKIASLTLSDFAIEGKFINVTLTLGSYDSAKLKSLPDEGTGSGQISYMDFSQIEVLMAFGLKTSELSYFHIQGTASIALWSLNLSDIPVDFHISVDGETVKVYGTISDIPLELLFLGVKGAFGKRKVTFVYEPGYVYLSGNDDYNWPYSDTTDFHKVKDTYFMDHLAEYLLKDMLQLRDTWYDKIDSTQSDSTGKQVAYEDVLSSFSYANSTGIAPVWDLVLNLGALTNSDQLKNLTVTIGGTDSNTADEVLEGYLSHLKASMQIVAGVSIKVGVDASLVDIGASDASFFETTFANFISAHASDTVEGA